jgi:hypothetical protein
MKWDRGFVWNRVALRPSDMVAGSELVGKMLAKLSLRMAMNGCEGRME